MKVGKQIASWPPDVGAEAKFRVENWDSDEPCPSEEEFGEAICDDSAFWEFEWEDMLYGIKPVMKLKSTTGCWRAEVHNFGWRGLDGEKRFKAETASDLLQAVLPRCECSFKVYRYGKGLAINNAHHDSPMWAEWYYILPISYASLLR